MTFDSHEDLTHDLEHDHCGCEMAHDHEENESNTVIRAMPKIGRNDPCYCGSGLKFKKCCLI